MTHYCTRCGHWLPLPAYAMCRDCISKLLTKEDPWSR